MTLSQIQYFLTAARCLNFTVAAREMYITQPALGRQISAMEEELGVKLFLRNKNFLSLTPVGAMLHKKFTSLMVNYNEILQKIYAMGQEDSVHMRIGMLEGYGLGDILPRFLHLCQMEHPGLMVELFSASYLELKQQLLEGELDIILTFRHDLQEAAGYPISSPAGDSYLFRPSPGRSGSGADAAGRSASDSQFPRGLRRSLFQRQSCL